jgi:UDP-3-O-[3-hydroxymyristoyl] N-acetylglucosamine deacetylase
MPNQHTLNDEIAFTGIGLHSGCPVNMVLRPAPPGTGVVFRRTDLDGFPVEANAAHIANVSYATTLMKRGVMISTVEHVLSALYALGVDNAVIDVDNLEVPILDGSAHPYVEQIMEAGLNSQDAPRQVLRIRQEVHHTLGDKTISARPADGFRVSYGIHFDHPVIGRQEMTYQLALDGFRREVAPCRTFGFLKEISALKENGLIKGGSLDNAVVLSDTAVLNPEGLRYPDEFIRHKVLDFLGDISLLGHPVLGDFQVFKGGHGLHAALVRHILADPAHYAVETQDKSPAASVVA